MALPVDDGDQIPEPTTPPLPMLLGASCTGGQSIPIHVLRAIHHKGDLDTVARWFDAAPTRDIDEAFFARSRREVLTLRALALKGRAETADAVLSFVFGLPDGVAWNILSFWRCYYRISVAGDIHWHAGPW